MSMPTVWLVRPSGATAGTLAYTRLTAVPKYIDVGTWVVDCPLNARNAIAAEDGVAGWRLAIMDGTEPIMAGPVEGCEILLGDEQGGRTATIRYSGVDDMVWLSRRNVRPVPANTLAAQTVGYDVRTGLASTVLTQYIDVNAGPSARSERRVAHLTVDPISTPFGASVTGRGRFQSLLELAQDIGVAGGIGVRVRSDMTAARRVQLYEPRDLTGLARFSLSLRNLRRVRWSIAAPEATTIEAGGRGEEDAREFISVTDSGEETSWGRREGFYDFRSASGSDSGAELTAGANKRLDEAGQTQQVEVTPVDTTRMTYGLGYGLGDLVTVDVYGGITMESVIREVEITVDRSGDRPTRTVVPRVGDIGTASPNATTNTVIKRLTGRVSRLERR
ncbi:hypothetical protein JOF56_011602 [Kibdelosporangium banguiense]|uniref:Gp28/Gp37-like domain-containing protein n=1 Tax=Kibdelosporangium banguiense TaxID=1365924 RepID=A0ABS4U3H5_9PSEU|nr:siphovirus ReqiPepy6 Gp37-like family protein [Kibdelosporangium banguiense]MBP2331217.1 hypothetical protein [Kibdelosporangium banguiense]